MPETVFDLDPDLFALLVLTQTKKIHPFANNFLLQISLRAILYTKCVHFAHQNLQNQTYMEKI